MLSQRSYCVSHEIPLVPEALFDYAIGIGEYHPPRGAHISAIDPYWHGMRDCSFGAAGNYAIVRAMARLPPARLTGIFSHRKIISRRLIGIESGRYPVYREITPSEASRLSHEDTQPNGNEEFLIGMPVRFSQGLAHQYGESHHAVDLQDYLATATEAGELSPAEVEEFLQETIFIPGGCELGIYPTDWLQPTLSKLERLARAFLTRYAHRIRSYDDYQVRAIGFLAERLGSFLLLKRLKERYPHGVPVSIVGHLCVVVPDGNSYDAALAD